LRLLRKLLRDQKGQSTTEYSVIVFFCIVTGVLFVYIFTGSLAAYHSIVSSVVCLPVP
jgi:Flp pilus assembly pilin Flp